MTTIDELIEKAAIALAVDDFAGAQFSQWTDGAKEPYLRRAKAVADALALSSLQEQKRKLEEASRAFVAKFDECKPHIDDAFMHRQMRIGEYKGPQCGQELKALRALLSGGGEG